MNEIGLQLTSKQDSGGSLRAAASADMAPNAAAHTSALAREMRSHNRPQACAPRCCCSAARSHTVPSTLAA